LCALREGKLLSSVHIRKNKLDARCVAMYRSQKAKSLSNSDASGFGA